MIVEVTTSTLGCYSDWCVYDRYTNIIGISLFGSRNGVNAVWARLQGKRRDSTVLVNNRDMRLQEKTHYVTLQAPLPAKGPDGHHRILVHPDTTNQASVFGSSFMLLSNTPEESFWLRFNRMCPIPLKDAWRQAIWDIGMREGLITSYDSEGAMGGYHIVTNSKNWLEPIKLGMKNGDLS